MLLGFENFMKAIDQMIVKVYIFGKVFLLKLQKFQTVSHESYKILLQQKLKI